MSVSLSTGSGTVKAALKVRGDDFYASPPVAVHGLLAVEKLPGIIWEPACGDGAIVNILRASGHHVIATDLVERGCDDSTSAVDFLMEHKAPVDTTAIVTNPPFKLAEEFVEHALTLCPRVYMLLRLAFLEGMRWDRGLKKGLARIHVCSRRAFRLCIATTLTARATATAACHSLGTSGTRAIAASRQ